MAEKTLILVVDFLPRDERDWLWMPDLNVVCVARSLSAAGRRRALLEVSSEWHRSYLQLVEDPPQECPEAS